MWRRHPIYAPMGYKPNSKPDPEPIILVARLKLAKQSGGEFIHKDGQQIYKWLYDKMYYADYNGSTFGSWFPWLGEELPAGELRELKSYD